MSREKLIVVDCKGHLLGRLASYVAKELLNGQKIVCVRCEEINVAGSLFRNQLLFKRYLVHRGGTNPGRGPFHYRAPSRMLWKAIRGMLPKEKKRSNLAFARLQVKEGCPHPYDKMKKVVIPGALRALRLKPHRKYCRLGDLSARVGWSHNDLIKRLETKRLIRSKAFSAQKQTIEGLKQKAKAHVTTLLAQNKLKLDNKIYPLTEPKKKDRKAKSDKRKAARKQAAADKKKVSA
eukprot:TRINITY_DN5270_c0_g1_i1.p1 TRINITY_DN5270_c0_g1~~TRINITY_DN5270_c0_g1_i1.p1  ORF type:complete len:235 (+),score=50.84 TRINITY_DN5270_c0_g1_i1:24-728(+)